jgi:hypothetical protein
MKSSIAMIIVGAALVLAGVAVPICLLSQIIKQGSHSQDNEFKVPGTAQITAVNPGRYYLWNDYQTVFEGKSYDRSEKVPDGFEVHIRDSAGHELQFFSETSAMWGAGSVQKKSIGYVEVQQPGKLEISVSNLSQERILSFSQLGLMSLFLDVVGIGASIVLGVFGGVALAIIGIVRLVTKKSKRVSPETVRG